MKQKNRPVVIELEADAPVSPGLAPVVPDIEADRANTSDASNARAMETLSVLGARKPSVLWRLFWAAAVGVIGAMISVAAWDFAFGLLARNVWLGRAVLAGLAIVLLAGLGLAFREWVAFVRFRRVDGLREMVAVAARQGTLEQAQAVQARLRRLYAGRAEMRWALKNLTAQTSGILDADALIAVTERALMQQLDAAARREVEAAARQVATITAIVPLALADVLTALVANMRMVRRIAEIYGGRAGLFGSWRLLRTVMLHLVATGAVSVGDDMIHSVIGGGLVGKLSRRFGEGVVNGALTARVGVAAMDVCRPMPFETLARPKVTALVKGALAGVFSKG